MQSDFKISSPAAPPRQQPTRGSNADPALAARTGAPQRNALRSENRRRTTNRCQNGKSELPGIYPVNPENSPPTGFDRSETAPAVRHAADAASTPPHPVRSPRFNPTDRNAIHSENDPHRVPTTAKISKTTSCESTHEPREPASSTAPRRATCPGLQPHPHTAPPPD